MTTKEKQLKTSKPAAWKSMFTLVRGSAFTAVEVLAALALDGWMSVALWVMVAWNVVWLFLAINGMAMMAVRYMESQSTGSESR